MNYDKWIPLFPTIKYSKNEFQKLISLHEEFQDTVSTPSEAAPTKPGQLFNYQKFDQRYMRIYDRLLMYYEAGTGKTCGYISAAEEFQDHDPERLNILSNAVDDFIGNYQGIVKEIIVLFKGKSLMEEFKKQLVCKCTPGTYITTNVKEAKSDKAQKMAVSKSINRWYNLNTYGTFCNKLMKQNLSDEELSQRFEGCMFVCDEIHSIKYETIVEEDDEETEEDLEDETNAERVVTSKNDLYTKRYQMLWRVFHAPKWCKVVLATATPMINDANDLIGPMNLLLPKEEQIPDRSDLKKWTIDQFQKYMMGYVSFIRAGDTGVDKIYTGEPLDREYRLPNGDLVASQMKVEQYQMDDFQSAYYIEEKERNSTGVRNDERQAAAFIFPDGSFGGSFPRLQSDGKRRKKGPYNTYGLGKYISSNTKDSYKGTQEFIQATNSITKIRRLSVLYAEIIDQAMKSPGICFIYNELLFGSGAIALAMCFESMGFKRFNESSSVFIEDGVGGGGSRTIPYCGSTGSGNKRVRINKELRYALITSETSSLKDEKMKELLNSPENKNGEYIKILIGSEVTRDGINLANVQDVFLPSMWTPAGMYQAEQRAIRATSHVELVKEFPGGRVPVHIHRMAAYAVGKDNTVHSVDIDMYAIAEKKEREIAIVRRMVKRVAVDAILQYKRNQRDPPEMRGSSSCDYTECDYDTVSTIEPGEASEPFVKMLFYPDTVVPTLISILSNELVKTNYLYLTEFIQQYEYYEEWWDLAIIKMIDDNLLVRNRFHQECRVDRDGDIIYLIPYDCTSTSMLDNYYASTMIATKELNLNAYIAERALVTVMEREQATVEAPPAITRDATDVNVDAIIMEQAVLKDEAERTDKERFVLERYKRFLFEIKEPVNVLEDHREKRLTKKSRGRLSTQAKIKYLPEPLPAAVETGETVYVHTLYTIPAEKTAYNVSAKLMNAEGRTRIYKPSESVGWRDTNIDEQIVYNAIIRGHIDEFMKPFNESKLYGSVFTDNQFRIHDLRKWNPPPGEKIDMRKLPRGLTCLKSQGSWKIDELLEIAKTLNIEAPEEEDTSLSKQQLKELLSTSIDFRNRIEDMDKYSRDDLEYIYRWMKSDFNRPMLCDVIKGAFNDKGLLLQM